MTSKIELIAPSSIVQWLAYLLTDPAALSLIPSNPEIFSEENIADVDEVNQQRCLEESGQWLEYAY